MATFPYMGRIVLDQSNEKVREILYKNYRIIYEIKDNFIEVLVVIHREVVFYGFKVLDLNFIHLKF